MSKPQYALTGTPSVRQRYNNFFIHRSAKSRNENQCQGIIFAAGKGTTFNQISIPKLLGMTTGANVLSLPAYTNRQGSESIQQRMNRVNSWLLLVFYG